MLESPSSDARLIGRDADFVVVMPQPEDTFADLAKAYLGNADRAWWISEFNRVAQPVPGQEVVIPLKPRNAGGVLLDGFQTVPVLCYHRFSNTRGKLAVTPAAFAEQLDYLERNQFRVVSLSELERFLLAGEKLPQRAIVITIDDGYRSTYDVAWPLLKKHGYPATVFLYSDFANTGGGLSWAQMSEMTRSGLIEVQPHSKTHSNLTLRVGKESDAQYRERIRREVDVPSEMILTRLGTKADAFAYPYGDTNATVIDQLARRRVALGFTVTPGSSGFFANPLMLRRTMVFGEDDLSAFAAKLAVFSKIPSR